MNGGHTHTRDNENYSIINYDIQGSLQRHDHKQTKTKQGENR